MTADPALSVVIASYNGNPWLPEIVDRLVSQSRAERRVEVVLVTPRLPVGVMAALRRFVSSGHLRLCRDPGTGLSRARNLGVAAARSGQLSFLDDSAVPADEWVDTVLDVFSDGRIDAFGGPVVPIWEWTPPVWFGPAFEKCIGSAINLERGPMHFPYAPMGANMGFRRHVFRACGLFDERLGRKPGQLLSGEEYEFFLRIYRRGGAVFFESRAMAFHHVPPDRMTKGYARRRFFWEGVTRIRTARIAGLDEYRFGYRFRELVNRSASVLHGPSPASTRSGPYARFLAECRAFLRLGEATETFNPFVARWQDTGASNLGKGLPYSAGDTGTPRE